MSNAFVENTKINGAAPKERETVYFVRRRHAEEVFKAIGGKFSIENGAKLDRYLVLIRYDGGSIMCADGYNCNQIRDRVQSNLDDERIAEICQIAVVDLDNRMPPICQIERSGASFIQFLERLMQVASRLKIERVRNRFDSGNWDDTQSSYDYDGDLNRLRARLAKIILFSTVDKYISIADTSTMPVEIDYSYELRRFTN